jgi:uncharacterized protein YcbK (DUF882 family)
MLPVVGPIKLATTVMSAWIAASTPLPLPAATIGLAFEAQVAQPIELVVHDDNRGGIETKIVLERDGSAVDAEMTKTVAHVFRCRTDREHAIAKRTLAMLAAVAEHYGKPIDLVSAYRVRRGEPWESPHRGARAIDFRIKGVPLKELRDWVWTHFTEVGVGWYPGDQFIHIDSRPGEPDISWTGGGGREFYKPRWADEARGIVPPRPVAGQRRPGV